jgi:hypothetical protein
VNVSASSSPLRSIYSGLAAIVLLCGTASALAEDVKVNLTGAEETPPVTTSATGTGLIRVTADRSIKGSIKTSGIQGTMAHIHLGAPGESGKPIVTLTKKGDDTWVVPYGAVLTDDQYASFKKGDLYVNVHSDEHKAGEIRAQLKNDTK